MGTLKKSSHQSWVTSPDSILLRYANTSFFETSDLSPKIRRKTSIKGNNTSSKPPSSKIFKTVNTLAHIDLRQLPGHCRIIDRSVLVEDQPPTAVLQRKGQSQPVNH